MISINWIAPICCIRSRQAGLTVGVGLECAGIHGKTFACPRFLCQIAANHLFNYMLQRLTLTKRPCRFLEKIEWLGASISKPERKNHR